MKPSILFNSNKLTPADHDKPKKEGQDPAPKAMMQRTITVTGDRAFTLFQNGLAKNERIPLQICVAADPDAAKPEDFKNVFRNGELMTLSPDWNAIRLDMPGVYRLEIPHSPKRKSPLVVGMY